MPRLTKNIIDSLTKPARGQIIVRDDGLPGFGVRLTPNFISFIAEGRLNGKSKRVTIGSYTTLQIEDARLEARRILADMAAGIEPRVESTEFKLTLGTALNQFLLTRDITPNTKLRYRRVIERNLPDWLELPITEISKTMVEIRHRSLAGATRCGSEGKARANSTFEVLRVVMKWAADRHQVNGQPLITVNPVDRLNQNRQWFKLQPRQGTIPDDRLADFYKAVMSHPKISRDYILFVLFSALRRREAAKLKWADIDWEKRTLTVPMNKSSRPHVLPLTQMLSAILESRKDNGSEYVFEGRWAGHLQEPRAVLAKLRVRMGWHWLIHDLRRSAVSAGEKAGVPFLALKMIAGHAPSKSVTERYVVLDTDFVRVHMETMNARLLQLMETSVERWRRADRSGAIVCNSGIGDQNAKKNGDQKAQLAIILIEEKLIAASHPIASSDWEDEVYF